MTVSAGLVRAAMLTAGIAASWSCGRESPVAPSPAAAPGADAAPLENPPATGADDEPAPPPSDPDPGPDPPEPPPPSPPAPMPGPSAVLVGAGDIAVCGGDGARLTAALLDTIGGIVFTAGDHAYSDGTREAFLDCYDPHWGRHRARTRPSPGNHDYRQPGAAPYFEYFGPSAGPPGRGYYGFMAGTWLVLSLNSNVDAGPGSAQLAWVRDELRAHPAACIAAIWHHPIVSSGRYGSNPHMRDVWRTLMEFGADLVVTAHDHIYERFEPLDADGYPSGSGIRQFVAGTGGAEPYEVGTVQPGSETRASVWGVLKLTLHSQWYEWAFVPVEDTSYRDEGAGTCT